MYWYSKQAKWRGRGIYDIQLVLLFSRCTLMIFISQIKLPEPKGEHVSTICVSAETNRHIFESAPPNLLHTHRFISTAQNNCRVEMENTEEKSFKTWANVQSLHVKMAPASCEVDVMVLTPLLPTWMVPTFCWPHSLPTPLPFYQRPLRSRPPQPVRWLAWPEPLLVHPPPLSERPLL